MYAEMRAGRTTTPHGGLYIKMSHLGPEKVAKQFKGMVERCADCGFDLAGGLVEVVPTAHYFMGGVVCNVDTSTELPGLFVAGEDASGMHGANRLGGNGVANSTVFGGIAGETMAAWVAANGGYREADEERSAPRWRARGIRSRARAATSTRCARRLLDAMWDDVGVIRDAAGLTARLEQARCDRGGIAGGRRAGWRPRLQSHLARLAQPALAGGGLEGDRARPHSSARTAAARIIREDFPGEGDLGRSTYTVARQHDGVLDIAEEPVRFTIVRPGQTLFKEAAE